MRFLAVGCSLALLPLFAQPPNLTSADLEPFLDGLIPAAIERSSIAGAVVAVVKDGQVVLQKGYGYADVATKKPVSPDATLFRPGSISKLFVWTSVMQLVEQGKLDLDHDINEYLDFKVPAGITMRDIMTHTAGFEETIRELFVPSEKEMATLRDYLTGHEPRQIFVAGKVPAYSNYACSLAGYIVQRLSGEPFSTYAANHILTPLAMNHTTFVQPLPPALKPLMSTGYNLSTQPAKGFEFVKAYPAGSVSTTAADMTRFMMMQLNNGRLGDVQILKPETAIEMHTRQASPYPAMHAMALGFYEESRNGHRIIGHGGDTQWFHSNLSLILDANTGLFISQNSAGQQGDLRGLVMRKFMDRYFPWPLPKIVPLATAKQDAQAVAGHYINSRRSEGGLPTVLSAFSQVVITPHDDGSITGMFKRPDGEFKKLHEISPLVFRAEDSEDRVEFRKDDQGHWEMNMGYPFMVFQHTGFWNNSNISLTIIGFGVCVIALALLGWPIAAAIRWHYAQQVLLTPSERRLRRVVQFFCVMEAFFLIGLVMLATAMSAGVEGLGPAIDAKQHFVQFLGWFAALGIPVALYAALRTWTNRGAWWFAKLRDTGIALAFCACTFFAWYWQVLNFTTRY
ncbi:MAG TPA: serine hydrolase domain-containing protein [Bryobacteraceae bacterium]